MRRAVTRQIENFHWALYCSLHGAAQYTAQLWRIVRLSTCGVQGYDDIEIFQVRVFELPF